MNDPLRVREPTSVPLPRVSPRVVVLIAALLTVAVIFWVGRDALMPFILAAVLIYLFDWPVGWLQRHRVPRLLGILIVLGASAVVLVGLFLLLAGMLVRGAERFIGALQRLQDQSQQAVASSGLPQPFVDAANQGTNALVSWLSSINLSVLLPVAETVLGAVGTALTYILIPFFVAYVLNDRDKLVASWRHAVPGDWRPDADAITDRIGRILSAYIRGEAITIAVMSVLTFLAVMLLALVVDPAFADYAVFLAVMAAFAELIPGFGPIILLIPWVIISLSISPEALLVSLLVWVVLQQFEANFLVPRVEGRILEIHPALVILAATVGLIGFGIVGAVLAIPVAKSLMDVYRYLWQRANGMPAPVEDGAEVANAAEPEILSEGRALAETDA